MITEALASVVDGTDLSEDQAQAVMSEVMDGRLSPVQIGALLAALRTKRESVDELVGFVRAMRSRAVAVNCRRKPLLDMCGTGGDYSGTFNISTTAAFVVAAGGVAVAKHGNRAISSSCGSADVLEALGASIELGEDAIAECIDTVGIGFMFAPKHHPAVRHASGPRRELGIRTVFNVLGPMANPAGATRQLIGVFEEDLCPKLAEALGALGCERAMVVHGVDGLDEVSVIGPTKISHLQHGRISTETRIPAEFNVVPAKLQDIRAGETPDENAAIVRSVLSGEKGPRRDVVSVNAAAGLLVSGLADTWRDGLGLAHSLIDSRRALRVLDDFVEMTRGLGPTA